MSAAEDFLVGYFRLMNMNGAAHVYREAGRAGIFRELMSSGKTAAVLAEACGTVLRPMQLMLDALVPLGVVIEADDQAYALSPLGQMLLGGSYRNLGDEYWSHLPSFLATGAPLIKMDDVAQSESHYQMQAAILGWMLSPAARAAARPLRDTLPPSAAILDVGAGSGVWSLTLAKETSDATVTAIDWKAVLEVAMETAEQLGLPNRLTTIAGNYHEVEFPVGRFDLVILANVTHLESPDGNRHLIAKAWQALKPQGRIAIIDVFPGQSHGDLNRTLYTLGLALRTERGRMYSTEELTALLRESGFNASQLLPLDVPPFVMGMLLAGPREQGWAAGPTC
jgi:ubiquinone/menaquinone biosynthesis C-methylase UbiE